MTEKYIYKIIIVGNTQVGKSCLSLKYCYDTYNNFEPETIGVSYCTKQFMHDDILKKVCIWDTAGQERFFSIAKMYFNKANGVICMYDVSNIKSLIYCEHWIKEIFNNVNIFSDDTTTKNILISETSDSQNFEMKDTDKSYDIPIILIGNKIDLTKPSQEQLNIIKNYEKKYNIKNYFISVKNDELNEVSINDIFFNLIEKMKPTIITKDVILAKENNSCKCF